MCMVDHSWYNNFSTDFWFNLLEYKENSHNYFRSVGHKTPHRKKRYKLRIFANANNNTFDNLICSILDGKTSWPVMFSRLLQNDSADT